MKKIILGFVLGLSFTSFAYVLINPELPSMVGVTDTTQIDLTKADEIISDPLQPGMTVTSADLNAKFHSLNMKIAKIDCDNQGGTFTEADLSCLVDEVLSMIHDGQQYTVTFKRSQLESTKLVSNGTDPSSPDYYIGFSREFGYIDQTKCDNLGGTYDALGEACQATQEQCLNNNLFYTNNVNGMGFGGCISYIRLVYAYGDDTTIFGNNCTVDSTGNTLAVDFNGVSNSDSSSDDVAISCNVDAIKTQLGP